MRERAHRVGIRARRLSKGIEAKAPHCLWMTGIVRHVVDQGVKLAHGAFSNLILCEVVHVVEPECRCSRRARSRAPVSAT